MLKEKNHRKFRTYATSTNSATIRKEVIPSDSSDRFVWDRRDKDDYNAWLKRTSKSTALNRPDPFGIQNCYVDYSMNKKKRWMIPDEIEKRIEDVQACFTIISNYLDHDPHKNLRVSSSLHEVDLSENLFIDLYLGNPIADRPCKKVHDVSRDGAIKSKNSKTGKSRLRDLMETPESRDKKNDNEALHIHYFAWEPVDSNSLYNKRAHGQHRGRGWYDYTAKHPKYLNNRVDEDYVVC